MRYLALAIFVACLPLFINLLQQKPHRRPWAMAGLAFLMYGGGAVHLDAAIITWPLWNGTSRGYQLGVFDMLSVALILTRKPVPGRMPYWGLFAFYALPLCMSIIPSAVPTATTFSWWQTGRVVLAFAAVGGEAHRLDMRGGVLAGMALGVMLQGFFVLSEKISGVVQASGSVGHQNALGMMVELALLPLLAALLAGDRRKIVLCGIVASVLVIAAGGSRGTMAFAGGGAAILILLSLIRGATPIMLRVSALAAVAVLLASPVAFLTLKDRFRGGDVTVQDNERPAFERAARAMSRDYPLGVGANMYVSIANLQGYAERAGVNWLQTNRSAPVHNAYLLARAETGWLGETAFFLLLFVPLVGGLHVAFRQRRGAAGQAALGSAVALGVNMLHNGYEYAVFTFNVLPIVIVHIAFIAAIVRQSKFAHGKAQPRSGPTQGARPGSTLEKQQLAMPGGRA